MLTLVSLRRPDETELIRTGTTGPEDEPGLLLPAERLVAIESSAVAQRLSNVSSGLAQALRIRLRTIARYQAKV